MWILLFFAFIVIVVVLIPKKNAAQGVGDGFVENMNIVDGLSVYLRMLMKQSQDAGVTAALENLSETVKYAEPMTNRITANQEKLILRNVDKLRTAFNDGDMAAVKELCEKINMLFIERDKILMGSKA